MTAAMVPDIQTLRIGVLCGGASPERPGSIASGEHASKALTDAGISTDLIDVADIPLSALQGRIDVALLGLHGLGGEDGKIQGALETARIPYTGSGVLASAIGMHKPTFKNLALKEHLDTPRWVMIDPQVSVTHTLSVVRHSIGFPVFVKPSSGGGSLAAGIAHDETQLSRMIEAAHAEPYAEYMVEEYIQGLPCTVGLIEIDGRVMTLPVLDVETTREFYDYEAKHDPTLRTEHCPSILPQHMTDSMKYMARRVWRMIGAHGVLRVDFMAGANGRVTILECNTLPGLSARGNLATMAKASGISYPALIQHIVRTAFTKPAYLP
ncbi:D-alanine--D-alanine ligase family protein [Streptomyces griseomycini]|uniref:D-alanine-D-alanine ligase n=1 Tax=Streptomyces griseomycini TaxID=66895 RepID=A0A7W7V9X7_9ACTN|nr:D-alanine--D-alanine ligase [Streptomyces griseomycini]MBB4902533.1 D-alanine-D-alanine ligase [Streptomyces griseomycini]GGR52268.1 D-alanine--D-alanine ligase [Streptomyces griseomycini]